MHKQAGEVRDIPSKFVSVLSNSDFALPKSGFYFFFSRILSKLIFVLFLLIFHNY